MKVVLYDDKGNVFDVVENIQSYQSTLSSIRWENGSIDGIQTDFVVVDDTVEPSAITTDHHLSFLRKVRKREFSEYAGKLIVGEFTTSLGYTFSYENHDQRNWTSKVLELSLDTTITSVTWKTENSGDVIFTRDDFIKQWKELEINKTNILETYKQRKVDLKNATTKDEIKNMTFEGGTTSV